MLHEPLRAVGRQSTLLHAVQHGGVSCMGVTNPSLALSGHARRFRAETLCSAKRGKDKGVRGALPHGGWDRVLDFVLTHVLIARRLGLGRAMDRRLAGKSLPGACPSPAPLPPVDCGAPEGSGPPSHVGSSEEHPCPNCRL